MERANRHETRGTETFGTCVPSPAGGSGPWSVWPWLLLPFLWRNFPELLLPGSGRGGGAAPHPALGLSAAVQTPVLPPGGHWVQRLEWVLTHLSFSHMRTHTCTQPWIHVCVYVMKPPSGVWKARVPESCGRLHFGPVSPRGTRSPLRSPCCSVLSEPHAPARCPARAQLRCTPGPCTSVFVICLDAEKSSSAQLA